MAKSNWYGSPIKIFEYSILGKPIVAPITPAVMDVMANEIDGLLVKMNKNEVAKALNRILEQPALGDQLGNNFKRKVLQNYTWKKAAENIQMEFLEAQIS